MKKRQIVYQDQAGQMFDVKKRSDQRCKWNGGKVEQRGEETGKSMQLRQRSAFQFAHLQHRRADPEFGQHAGEQDGIAGHLGNTKVRLSQQPGEQKHRPPAQDLGDPFGAGGPGDTARKMNVQLARVPGTILNHRVLAVALPLSSDGEALEIRAFHNKNGLSTMKYEPMARAIEKAISTGNIRSAPGKRLAKG